MPAGLGRSREDHIGIVAHDTIIICRKSFQVNDLTAA
jgi:hypothetical protein